MTHRTQTVLERFWSKVDEGDPEDCWLWEGHIQQSRGYGEFFLHKVPGRPRRNVTVLAHRFVYEITHGPIPQGMQIDHVCRVRRCVNPRHLRLVTPKQNNENTSPIGRGRAGVRGVVWNKKGQIWIARVNHNRRKHGAGRFYDLAAAAEAARLLRNQLFTHNDADRA